MSRTRAVFSRAHRAIGGSMVWVANHRSGHDAGQRHVIRHRRRGLPAPTAPLRALLCFMLAAALAACSISGRGSGGTGTALETPATGPKTGGVKVAMLLPLSAAGPAAATAKALKQAGELALLDLDNPTVELVAKDTAGTPEGARAAAREAIAEGAELILGPLFAAEVSAVAAEAGPANIPVVAFSSDRKVAGRGVYLLSFLAGSEVLRIVSHAAGKGAKRFAALIPQTDYGRVAEAAFMQAVSQTGGQVVSVQSFPADANGMLPPVKAIAELGRKGAPAQVDAILIPAGAETLPSLTALLPYFDVDTANIRLLGTAAWDYAGVGGEAPLVGGLFAAPDPKGWQDFTRRYVENYRDPPPRLATLGYDAVSLAIALAGGPKGQRFAAASLTRGSGFNGLDGLFRLKADGTSERSLAVLEVQRYANQVVEPAAAGFSGLGAPAQPGDRS